MENNSNQSLEQFGYQQELKRTLGIPRLVFYGLGYMNIIGAYTMYGVSTDMTKGMFALVCLIATLAMLFTAVSYSKMSSVFPIAGSSYSYTQRTMNSYWGFMIGWTIMMDYVLLPIVNFVLVGMYMNILIPSVPVWAWEFISIVLITLINVKGVKFSASSDTVITCVNGAFLIVCLIFMLRFLIEGNGAGEIITIEGFINSEALGDPNVGWGAVFQSVAVMCLCFLGFDAITTFSEETIEPEKRIGRSIIISCLLAGVIFIIIAYFSQLCWPDAYEHLENPDTGATEVILHYGGATMSFIFTVLYMLGCFGSGIASTASGARLLFVMGRDGVIPKIFGKVNKKTQVPVIATITIGLVGCIAMFTNFMAITSVINFGGLLAFTMVNICVIVHFIGKEKRRTPKDIFRYCIIPGIGAIITLVIWFNLDHMAHIIGFSWASIGFIYMVVMTKGFKKPPVELHID